MTSVGASATGRNAYFVIVAWMGVDISNGPAFVAILLAAGSVAEFLTTNLGGIIADRYERKLVCLVCDGLRMILMALTILGLCLLNPLAVLTVSWIAYSVIDRTYLTTLQAMIPALAPPDRLARVNSVSYINMQIGNLIAAVAAGLLLTMIPHALSLLLPLCCYVVSFCALSARRFKIQKMTPAPHLRIWDRGIFPTALPPEPLRLIAVVYALIYAMGMLVSVLASALVLSQFRRSALEFGYLEAFWAAGSIVGCLYVFIGGVRLQSQAGLLLISGSVLAVFLVIQNLTIAFLQMAVLGIAYNVARIVIDVNIQQVVPIEALGRCRAQLHTVCVALGLLTYAAMATAGNSFPPATVFGFFGLLMLLVGALLILRYRGAAATRSWSGT